MVHICRTVRPLIGARKGRRRIMFVEAFARDNRMFQVGRQYLQPGRDIVPIIKRCLHRWNNMRCVRIPSEIVRHDNQMSVTARLQ